MRKSRFYYEANFYHVMAQGDEKKYIFRKAESKHKIIQLLKDNAIRNSIQIVAYCIMDNHYHVLLYAPVLNDLSRMMSQTNTSFALYYSKLRKNVGHVFRDRFRSESIYTKQHMVSCIKYIHENPVKAHICESANKYYYSSYNEFGKISDELIKLCDLEQNDIEFILGSNSTDTIFIDDTHSIEEYLTIYKNACKKYACEENDSKKVALIYCYMKNNCPIFDNEIADLMKIGRKTLLRRLKEFGIKK